jgi:hypothetical protein
LPENPFGSADRTSFAQWTVTESIYATHPWIENTRWNLNVESQKRKRLLSLISQP